VRDPRTGVDGDSLHRRQVEHERAVARAAVRGPAAADRERQPAVRGHGERGGDVVARRAAGDRERVRGGPCVGHAPPALVLRVARADHVAREPRAQRVREPRVHRGGRHRVP
jgi:hypothetical protein